MLWRSGKLLVEDATCVDTFAPSYRSLAVHLAGAVVARKEALKEEKYAGLAHSHHFVPVAVETIQEYLEPIPLHSSELRCLHTNTGEKNYTKYMYLLQRLSMAVQRGNGVSILGCMDGCIITNFQQ